MNIEEFKFNQNNIEEIIENIINKISAWKKQPIPSDVEHKITIKVNNGKEREYYSFAQKEMEEHKNGIVTLTFKIVPRTPNFELNYYSNCPS